jgi:uncharacterized protein YfeS
VSDDTREPARPTVTPERAHPAAREALPDPFFWDTSDEGAPLGTDTGVEVLATVRADLAGERRGALALLAGLLTRWEVADEHWDVIDAAGVAAAGADDEYGVLMRDEIVLALAFAELIETGRIDAEIQRRALLATARQALPLLLAPWGDRTLERATRLERMGKVLARPRR